MSKIPAALNPSPRIFVKLNPLKIPVNPVHTSVGPSQSLSGLPSQSVIVEHIPSCHPMTTRSKTCFLKPRVYAALCEYPLSSFETEPHSVKATLTHPKWKQVMFDEYKALRKNQIRKNQTWSLVPTLVLCNIVGNK
ncbi:hypothetical protein ACOSP7_013686 [Xanthoceras sorbifolium]